MTQVVREKCGTLAGMIIHNQRGEPWCGSCVLADAVLRLEAERIAPPAEPLVLPHGRARPWTDEEVAHHAAVLHYEVGEAIKNAQFRSRYGGLRRVV